MTRIAPPRFPLRKAKHQVRNRRLFLEPLDQRLVLTGAAEIVVSEAPVPDELVAAEAAIAEQTTAECPSESSEPAVEPVDGQEEDPVDVETPTVEIDEPTPEPEIGVEEGGPGGADPDEAGPTIQGFQVTLDFASGEWVFSGTVLDNKSVDGLRVDFAGVLTGSATVQADGSFEFCVSLPPGIAGLVTANVTDCDGNPAPPVSVFLNT